MESGTREGVELPGFPEALDGQDTQRTSLNVKACWYNDPAGAESQGGAPMGFYRFSASRISSSTLFQTRGSRSILVWSLRRTVLCHGRSLTSMSEPL